MPPITWAVERVRAQITALTVSGAVKVFYLVLWRNYPPSASTWEPRANLNEQALTDDVANT